MTTPEKIAYSHSSNRLMWHRAGLGCHSVYDTSTGVLLDTLLLHAPDQWRRLQQYEYQAICIYSHKVFLTSVGGDTKTVWKEARCFVKTLAREDEAAGVPVLRPGFERYSHTYYREMWYRTDVNTIFRLGNYHAELRYGEDRRIRLCEYSW